jgi:hypothetical protein
MVSKLLTREQFSEQVIGRAKGKCVFCGDPATEAHHIMDRKLFKDGGYYLDNGAAVCNTCHMKCEDNTFTVEEVRKAAGITEVILPLDFDPDLLYDKWGNITLSDGTRVKGPLFEDTAVQKLLKRELRMYEHLVKYSSTPHLPQSRTRTEDDKVLKTIEHLLKFNGVATEKMDGENASLYNHHYHARSLDSRHHVSRDWIKSFWATIKEDIPVGWRVCGENLFAEHSIGYNDLPSYFLGFSVWTDKNECLGWDDSLEWFDLLGVTPVPVLYRGPISEQVIMDLIKGIDITVQEGFVLRNEGSFHYDDFASNVAKWVRPKHVQTDQHWMAKDVVPNGLRK